MSQMWRGARLALVLALGVAVVACGPAAPAQPASQAPSGAAPAQPAGQALSGAAPQAAPDAGSGQPGDELAALYEAAKREGRVVVAGPGASTREPATGGFMQKYPGVEVQPVTLRGADMMSRLQAELASGQRVMDVFLSAQGTMYAARQAGYFEPWAPPAAEALPADFRPPGNYYTAVSTGVYSIMYNTRLVAAADAPTGWRDLLDPKWKGKILYYDPRSAGSGQTSMIRFSKSPDLGWDFIEALGKQDLTFTRDRLQGVQQVAQGAYPLFAPADVGDETDLQKANAPTKLVFPPKEGFHLDVSFAGVLQGAPHPNAAKLLVNYLLTPEGQQQLAETGDYPIRPGVAGPGGRPPLSEMKTLPEVTEADRDRNDEFVKRFETIFR
ncbi:MAG TPA: extracellular solute-binding protein [Chloroflexota bacterium]|jgi:iron(III) transport system substrate-binding protein